MENETNRRNKKSALLEKEEKKRKFRTARRYCWKKETQMRKEDSALLEKRNSQEKGAHTMFRVKELKVDFRKFLHVFQ